MSVLASLTNLKIPYPTEGVIRTAQLDDTIAPANSVQLAVNMNFDRVGAIQTRLGVTQYADTIADAINSYGSLRNAILPPGFDFLFQQGTTQELSPNTFSYPSAVKISDTKIAVFWQGSAGHGFARNFSIDALTGTVSALGTATEFETGQNIQNKAVLMSANIVVNVWQQDTGGAAFAAGFNVLDDTIVAGTPYQFESVGFDFGLAMVDSNRAIVFYGVTSGDGIASILAVNSSTLVITEPGSPTTFSTGSTVRWNSCVLVNSTHVLNFWNEGAAVKAQVFSVNLSTWAIAAVGSTLAFAATGTRSNAVSVGDGSHFIDFYKSGSTLSGQTVAVNLSTFAVTTIGTPLPNAVVAADDLTVVQMDTTHYVAFYSTGAGHGFVQMIEMNGSTFDLTFLADRVSGYDFGLVFSTTPLNLNSTEVMVVWGATDDTGKAAMFKPYGNVVEGRWLYAGAADKVYNTVSGAWTARRTGLAQVSKPRYSQYLNYIWMVNGNEMIGGDPVATSNGGNFNGDLIPSGFPSGDFIHAGFEGRVWVANRTLGIIYYTDIVQFFPPATYVLTYNPSVNFITQVAPQTGQSITALFRVPRALLVFTEDSIFRIYGATSVDAYPAYNVGTFSSESIIETKTGIFFHHSSGFYQFDYGSQPVEISRRIIDFVKAIPRSYYDDITGVYDGFDCVEWSIGPVTVEGVAYANCMVRYTISTQVWTIYDFVNNVIRAMIYYDDGTNLNHLMGTAAGKTGAIETGYTDFGEPFYYEFIDRWRAFTDMYYQTKSLSGLSVYSENAAGANLTYQIQKSGPNAWKPIGTVTEENNAVMPNSGTDDFDVLRLRLAGNTKGAQVVVHGIEITQLTIKGQDEN